MRALILCLCLTGCATCDTHPVACVVGEAILVGGIAAVATSDNQQQQLPIHQHDKHL